MLDLSERQEKIRTLLTTQGRLSVTRLVEQMDVAAMTIRRDLIALEKAGLLTRTHGGCVLHSPFVAELSFPVKQRLRQEHKTAIAGEAIRRLKRDETVYLDTGTTALQVARTLPPDLALQVFTNNLRIAMELFGRTGITITVYGGVMAHKNPDLAGEMALAQIQQYRLDVAIVGGDALDIGRGEFYGADARTALLSRAAQKQANRVIVVMDSSKFGKRGLAVAGRLGPGVTMITDNEVNRKDRAILRRTGAEMVFAATPSANSK
ncbi:MAG: DeoR/GlpR transcriptional regulator [Verrucomicrobia bacterium]|nr:DeoR/GlpR transcriptional regulator [Verrucomicrobiota bacterium]